MKYPTIAATALALSAGAASAATFTPMFDTPSFPGSQFNVESDPTYNAFYSSNFGITVENSYLYRDSRDTFDGTGIANGEREVTGTPQTGRINFLDTTDFVTIDYLAILPGTWSAFSSGGSLIDSFSSTGGDDNGTQTLSGGIISYIEFSGSGGFVTVSGLTYNYDGTTDGVNDDLPPVSAVPLPAGFPLLFAGLIGLGTLARRKKSA